MLTGHQEPLQIAASVLKASTMSGIRRSPSFHLVGWKILDRWAFNSPDQLRTLESQGELILLERLLRQQGLEQEVLSRSQEQLREGMTEHEVLQANEIQTEL